MPSQLEVIIMQDPKPDSTADSTSSDKPEFHPDASVDIAAYACPMTFVRTRLALDRLQPGQILAVRLKGPEPRTNVPLTAQQLGHQVLALHDEPDGTSLLIIRKA